jgi:hypothetical protein
MTPLPLPLWRNEENLTCNNQTYYLQVGCEMNSAKPSDKEILHLVNKVDKELLLTGMDVKLRYWEVPRVVMQRLGYTHYVGRPAILHRIEAAFSSIYRKGDIALGGHIGVFMYRDIFARIGVPVQVYGQVVINPFEWVQLTPVQLEIIQTEPAEMATYLDQFADVWDIQHGNSQLKPQFMEIELVRRYVGRARLHLHAAAAIVTGGYDYRGAVQSSLLANELSLKACVAADEVCEKCIKRFGHDTGKLLKFIKVRWPAFESDRVGRVLKKNPDYVANRYSEIQPSRREVGTIVMGAQYVVSEAIRLLSEDNFRSNVNWRRIRVYPE